MTWLPLVLVVVAAVLLLAEGPPARRPARHLLVAPDGSPALGPPGIGPRRAPRLAIVLRRYGLAGPTHDVTTARRAGSTPTLAAPTSAVPQVDRWHGRVRRALVVSSRRLLEGRRAERDLVDVLDALAAALRSGATPRAAFEEVAVSARGPLRADLLVIAHEVAHGEPLTAALERWAHRRPLPGVRLVVAVLCLGTRTGGDLARAVEDVAATERHRSATRDEVRSLSAQARLSAVVVACAPVAFTVVAALADPGVGSFLLGSAPGWACLVGGVALDAAGMAWMRAITARVG